MKGNITVLFGTMITLASCGAIINSINKKIYVNELSIDYKNVSYQGQNSSQHLYFEIDSINGWMGLWYHGKIIINHNDTLRVSGYQKANRYYSFSKSTPDRPAIDFDIGKMWRYGQIPDSLYISGPLVTEGTVLLRRPRRCQ